jgi:hypothetical protein
VTEFCVVGYYFFGVRIIEYDLKAVISLSVCGGEKRIDIRRFLGYVCQIAKVRVRINFGWVSIFTQKYVKGMTICHRICTYLIFRIVFLFYGI